MAFLLRAGAESCAGLARCRFDTVDVHKKGRIGYGEFLSMLVPRGDNKPSMYHDSFKSYMRKGSFYSLVPQGVAPVRLGTNGKLTAVGRLSVRDIQQVMRKKLSAQYTNMKALLDQRDQDATGFVSKHLLLQVLRKLDVFITTPQLEEVAVTALPASPLFSMVWRRVERFAVLADEVLVLVIVRLGQT